MHCKHTCKKTSNQPLTCLSAARLAKNNVPLSPSSLCKIFVSSPMSVSVMEVNWKSNSRENLSGRHRGIASLVLSHRGKRIAEDFRSENAHRQDFCIASRRHSVFSTHCRSHRIAPRIARYGPLRGEPLSVMRDFRPTFPQICLENLLTWT